MTRLFIATTVALVLSLVPARSGDDPERANLGESLFFDVNLSKDRTQACSTCHAPDYAFTDPRETAAGRAASLGDDGKSLGDRNAPAAAYASFAPAFGRNVKGRWAGGQFHDGREPDLEGQAGGPPLNPLEMAMPSKSAVVGRLRENPDYLSRFQKIFGKDVFADDAARL